MVVVVWVVIARWSQSTNLTYVGPARFVLRWMTVSGFNSQCGTFISVCNQPPRSTQPGHPFVGRHNEYKPKGCDALRLGGMVSVWVAGKTV